MECCVLKKPAKRKPAMPAWLTPEYITAVASLLTAVRPYLLFGALALFPLLRGDEKPLGIGVSANPIPQIERGE
jgi:hypothetical protein